MKRFVMCSVGFDYSKNPPEVRCYIDRMGRLTRDRLYAMRYRSEAEAWEHATAAGFTHEDELHTEEDGMDSATRDWLLEHGINADRPLFALAKVDRHGAVFAEPPPTKYEWLTKDGAIASRPEDIYYFAAQQTGYNLGSRIDEPGIYAIQPVHWPDGPWPKPRGEASGWVEREPPRPPGQGNLYQMMQALLGTEGDFMQQLRLLERDDEE